MRVLQGSGNGVESIALFETLASVLRLSRFTDTAHRSRNPRINKVGENALCDRVISERSKIFRRNFIELIHAGQLTKIVALRTCKT